MSIEKLFDQNPHATLLVQSWFMGKLLESLNESSIPDDFKEMLKEKGVEKEQLIKMVEASPRSLFDVLDENDIFISIVYDSENKCFRYSFDNKVESNDFDVRKEAEYSAISLAFKMLDDKIKETEA